MLQLTLRWLSNDHSRDRPIISVQSGIQSSRTSWAYTVAVTQTNLHKHHSAVRCHTVSKAIFDLTESEFRFIVNPDLDSLANQMVWIVGVVEYDFTVVCLRWWWHDVILLLSTSCFASESGQNWICWISALNWRFHQIQSESKFGFGISNMP